VRFVIAIWPRDEIFRKSLVILEFSRPEDQSLIFSQDSADLRSRGSVAKFDLEELRTHFVRFPDPGNMFLIPIEWSGLGEVPEVIQAVREIQLSRR
jgi:hypothetical protein